MSSLIKDVHDALYAISSFPSILSIPRRTVEGRTDIQGGNGSLAQIKISEDALSKITPFTFGISIIPQALCSTAIIAKCPPEECPIR